MKRHGFTIIELLIILGTLSLILLATVSFLMSSLSSSGKAETLQEVRQNGEAVLRIAKTLLTSSTQVSDCTETVPNPVPTGISFISNGATIALNCVSDGDDSYIASNAARLTDSRVKVDASSCNLYCIQPSGGFGYVNISFTLEPASQVNLKEKEKVRQKFETSINLPGI